MKAHQKRKPYNSKTIEEKYEIIKHYKSIENTGRSIFVIIKLYITNLYETITTNSNKSLL